jgi:glycosyltransferase involved in cell wall biosynthesis
VQCSSIDASAVNERTVLIVEQSGDIGGAGVSLEALVSQPGELGRYRIAIAFGRSGSLADRLARQGLPVTVIPAQGWRWWPESWVDALKFFPALPLQFRSFVRWFRFVKRLRPDLVHLNDNRLVEPLLAAWMLKRPLLVHFRTIPSKASVRFLFGRRAFYTMMNLANRWIANSAATAADIEPHARVPVATVPNGIDLVAFDARAAEPWRQAKPRQHRVAMIALVNRWKRHDLFLDVARLVLLQCQDVVFSIAGVGDAECTAELKAKCLTLGLESHVEFVGHIDNVPAFLDTVDILVHTADPEPFGRVFLEAMAARKPVVAFRSGGPAEIVLDGETGYLIRSGETTAMAEAVARLLADPVSRARFGAAGRHRVERLYSVELYRSNILRQYDHVLNGSTHVEAGVA